MVRIKIDSDSAYSLSGILKRSKDTINSTYSSLYSSFYSLEWQVRQKSNIESVVSESKSLLNRISDDVYRMGIYVENAAAMLVGADKKSSNSLGKIYTAFERHIANKKTLQDKNPYYYEWPVPERNLEVTGKKRGQYGIIRYGVSTDYPNGHSGIDIWGNEGDPIISAYNGTITKVYTSKSYGNVVFVDTEIDKTKYQIIYAHLKDKPILKVGEKIKSGEIIGQIGHTGSANGINHLHFEVRKNGVAIDPEKDFFLLLQTKSTEWFRNLGYTQPNLNTSKEADSSAQLK